MLTALSSLQHKSPLSNGLLGSGGSNGFNPRLSNPMSCTCIWPMSTQTSHSPHASPKCSRGLSGASRDTGENESTSPRCLSPVWYSNEFWKAHIICLGSPNLTSKQQLQQLSQGSSDVANSPSSLEKHLTPAYILREAAWPLSHQFRPPCMQSSQSCDLRWTHSERGWPSPFPWPQGL